jgi:hypothetical protein
MEMGAMVENGKQKLEGLPFFGNSAPDARLGAALEKFTIYPQ